ncbi:MAG: OadG family protein [Ruminococcus sp.]|nr:OadG family protein [Ruminococcus sp.]
MDEKLTMSLTILLTGFIVVFAVLLLLIGIIKIYSTIVYNLQNKPKKSKKNNDDDDTPKGTGASGGSRSASAVGGVSPEVLACIAAAVDFIYGEGNVRIKNIRKAGSRSAWGHAGVLTNTRPF